MRLIYELRNTVQHYAWGSPDAIPKLLSIPNPTAMPFAELWMGTHPDAPSRVESDGTETGLDGLIGEAPAEMLGAACASRFESKLPFLFKLLAAAQPLSIQAHPTKAQAESGWERENALGIALNDPNRNYKDANHKPEIICAITPFEGLCGFRQLDEISRLCGRLELPCPSDLKTMLREGPANAAFKRLIEWTTDSSPTEKAETARIVARRAQLLSTDDADAELWKLIVRLSSFAAEDSSIIAPIFLNYVRLEPGEAMFLPAGVLHAYLDGFGVELMANSNNVLRGGLTPKHVDSAELAKVLRFEPYRPAVLLPASSRYPGLSEYRTPAEEFRLYALDSRGGSRNAALPDGVPSIVVVIDGSFMIKQNRGSHTTIGKGGSFFVAAGADSAALEGVGLAYIASVPQ